MISFPLSGLLSGPSWSARLIGGLILWILSGLAEAQELAQTEHFLIGKYCAECHRGEDAEGDFHIDQLRFEGDANPIGELMEDWDQVAKVLADTRMPPEDSVQPTEFEKQKLLDWIRGNAIPGNLFPAVRRMNRIEYENSIKLLFGLPRDGFSNPEKILMLDEYFDPRTRKMPRYVFAVSYYSVAQSARSELIGVSTPPSDLPALHGFNNEAAVLPLSPLLVEKYVQLSREIVDSPTLPAISTEWARLFELPVEVDDGHKVDAVDFGQMGIEARKNLSPFLRKAFRRPVTAVEVDQFGRIFDAHFANGHSFVDAMKVAVSAVLIAPDFLFVFQSPDIADFSLAQRRSLVNASRLSCFLWAGPPDEELLSIAEQGRLVTREEVITQARRMLLDQKIKSLSTSFGMQWLKVNRLASSQPDIDKFPLFYKRPLQPVGIGMMIEQLLLFETILVEDRSILDFIDANFAYLNNDLIEWYGLDPEKVVGASLSDYMYGDFFRVKLPPHGDRGGAITSGATLVLTSTSLRSSPVFRGVWVAETIFNRHFPPPPADVPALEEVAATSAGKDVSIRERLMLHRNDSQCSSCHDRIDPLGFGLEQFNSVGQFRSNYEDGNPVDSSGEIQGSKYNNIAEFKQSLLQNKDLFVRGFARHLLRYALNRELTLADEMEVDLIAGEITENEYSFHSTVIAIVASPLFRGPPLDSENPGTDR